MNYDYTNTSDASTLDPAVGGAILVGFLTFMFLFFVISYVITSFLLGQIFKKAGVPQWAAWVPIYNTWKLLELGNQSGFWAVLSLLPFINIVALIFVYIAMYHIGLKLGKEGWFVLIAIFLPIVWLIWLAFDDSKWPGEKKIRSSKSKGGRIPKNT